VGADEKGTCCVFIQSLTFAMSSGDSEGEADNSGDCGGVIGPARAEPSIRYFLLMVKREGHLSGDELMILTDSGDALQFPSPWCAVALASRTPRESTGSRVPDEMASNGVDLSQKRLYRRATNLWMKFVDLLMD
jgi:hypothetical protein